MFLSARVKLQHGVVFFCGASWWIGFWEGNRYKWSQNDPKLIPKWPEISWLVKWWSKWGSSCRSLVMEMFVAELHINNNWKSHGSLMFFWKPSRILLLRRVHLSDQNLGNCAVCRGREWTPPQLYRDYNQPLLGQATSIMQGNKGFGTLHSFWGCQLVPEELVRACFCMAKLPFRLWWFLSEKNNYLERLLCPIFFRQLETPKTSNKAAFKIGLSLAFQVEVRPNPCKKNKRIPQFFLVNFHGYQPLDPGPSTSKGGLKMEGFHFLPFSREIPFFRWILFGKMTFLEGFHYLAKWEIQLGEVARGFPHPRVPRVCHAGTENNLAQGKNI